MERFAFLIHPISVRTDVARKYPVARLLPESWVERAMTRMAPKVVSHITGIRSATGAEAEGWFIGCPLTPRQFLELDVQFVLAKISAAARIAEGMGAKIVGLGAYTSIAGDGGITVDRNAEIAVTTGNSYTCYTAIEGARRAAALMGVQPQAACVAVVGAAGSIGRVSAHLLAEGGVGELILVGRDRARLQAVAEELPGNADVGIATDLDEALPRADIIITVTSAVEAVIEPRHLKPGAVVCDVSRPRDVSVRVARERDDVLVIEGGVVSVPGDVEFHFNFGFPPRTSYACMAETMILALEGRYESFSLGKELDLARVKDIGALAAKHGFTLAGFRSFEKAVTDEQIARIREKAGR
ncbi:MAG TPA: shikimate dehydrogenase [Armatimonadota bacterium]|mgnify:CR=1 FL=1|nr:shikimate dehydrogenase [Armatimonadota bacterium]